MIHRRKYRRRMSGEKGGMRLPCLRDRVVGGILGLAVGDALGVPVEFRSREWLRQRPVRGMEGFGSHNQPPGTWSDDTSLALCSAESLLGGFDIEDTGRRFVRWLYEAHWTAYGDVFDYGTTTARAISKMRSGTPAAQAGCTEEDSNGNGSLMRILPHALYSSAAPEEQMLGALQSVSAITHAHPVSLIACGIYGLIVRRLLRGARPAKSYEDACEAALSAYEGTQMSRHLRPFGRFLSGTLDDLQEADIRSSGFVVDTLEASVWSILTTSCYKDAVLRAVNLGHDTDTTAAVAGGLAGVYYGSASIPAEWLEALARRRDIERLAEGFAEECGRVQDTQSLF
jgi:ADP-ribosylglycohydrolase